MEIKEIVMRIRCWWKGHCVSNNYNENRDDYRVCKHCNTHFEDIWNIDYSFWDRHESFTILCQIIGVSIGFILIVLTVVGIGSVIAYPFVRYSCQQTGLAMQIPWKFDYWTGCLYHIDGRWITDDLLAVVELLK